RLHLVATFALHATGREVEGASQCGFLVRPKDLEDELLPAIAIMLGRSPKARQGSDGVDGPTLLRAGTLLSDPQSLKAGCFIAVLLSALVAHRRQHSSGLIGFANDARDLGSCLELVAARNFVALEKLWILPKPDEVNHLSESPSPQFPWLSSLGHAVVVA